MKKIMAKTLMGAFLIANLNLPVYAAEVQESAGITPDSMLYSIDRAIENIQLSLTKDVLSKVELLTNMAKERLAEAKVMADEDKNELLVSTIEDAQNTEDKVEETINQGQTDVAASKDEANVQEELNKVEEAKKELEEYCKHSIERLNEILNKVPEQAKPAIQKAIAIQTLKIESKIKIEETKKSLIEDQKVVAGIDAKIEAKQKEIESLEKALEEAKKSGEQAIIDAAQLKLDAAKTDLDGLKKQLEDAKKAVEDDKKAIESVKEEFKTEKEKIMAAFKAVKAQLNPGKGKDKKEKKEEVKEEVKKEIKKEIKKDLNIEDKSKENKKNNEVKKNEHREKFNNDNKGKGDFHNAEEQNKEKENKN